MFSEKKQRITEYFVSAAVAGILFLCILAIRGLWPFGKETIDYYDMAQQAEAFYFHNYDELHGLKSFVLDWYTNLGRVIPGLSEPSAFDILLYFVPRGSLIGFMSVMMMIKIMAAAFFMGMFIRFLNRDMPFLFRMMISSGYGLCGFFLVDYTIPQWLDMAALVPLVLMFSQKALKEGKILGLSVSVFLIALIDIYFSTQTVMLVFFIGGAYVMMHCLVCRREKKRFDLFVFRFAVGIVSGIGLSAFSFLPDIVYSISSARFDNGSSGESLIGGYLTILRTISPAYLSRWFALLSIAFPTAVAVIGIISGIRRKKYYETGFSLICIFIVTAQLFLESIHLLLHFGSYVNYPVRNAFMIYCVVAGIAAYSYEKRQDEVDNNGTVFNLRSAVAVVAGIIVTVGFYKFYSSKSSISDHDVLVFTMGFMAACCIVHLFLLNVKWKQTGSVMLGLWVTELLVFGVLMIGKPLYDTPYGNDPEQEGEYIRIADQLVSKFGEMLTTGKEAATLRIKNPDTSLNANYGLVMQRETLSGWTSFATADQIKGATDLGYSSQYTRLLDSGGNIFSDTILHITDVIGTDDPDDKMYETTGSVSVVTDHIAGTVADYYLARNRYMLPFAIPVADPSALENTKGDIVDNMNAYAKAFGCSDSIASYVSGKEAVKEKNDHLITVTDIAVDGSKSLYLAGNRVDCEYRNTRISVNGRTVKIPSIKEIDNDLYPAHFNNNSVFLGSFIDEDVSVIVDTDLDISNEAIDTRIYQIDTGVLRELCDGMPDGIRVSQGRRSLNIITEDIAGKYKGLLIPVPYNDGWSATINGDKASVTGYNGLFMFIPINENYNDITLSYFPPFMKTGIALAIVFALIITLMTFVRNEKKAVLSSADNVAGILYATAFTIAFIIVYLFLQTL